MKFSPTVSLALVLAAGAAAAQTNGSPGVTATMPQTTAPNPQAGWQNGQSHPSFTQPAANTGRVYGQPQSNYGQTQQTQQGYNYPQATPNAQRQPPSGQAQNSPNYQVRDAQTALHAAGLYNGPIDGMMDPDTRAAIARFQQQSGLRRTETLDAQTQARLMSNQATGSGSSAPGAAAVPDGNQGPTSPPIGAGGNIPGQTTQP